MIHTAEGDRRPVIPVRVRVLVPEGGFSTLMFDLQHWLVAEVGSGNFAHQSAGTPLAEATAW